MSLTLREVTEVLHVYYPGQEWRCAEPINADPIVLDQYGNLVYGLQWFEYNTLAKPTIEQLQAHWEEFKATGEYQKTFPALPKDRRGPFVGKTSEYAQALLQYSDWAALPDTHLANQAEWDAYRAALRDIRSNPSDDVVWPTMPEARFI